VLALASCALPSFGAEFSVATHELELGGEMRNVDVYRPEQADIAGVAVIAHGFTRSRARHRDLARALANEGVVAVVPDLPNVVNLWGNGEAIAALVERLEAGVLPSLAVKRSRVVLIGTSAGGLATVLAAARLPGIAGWIGLDPVDRTGTGASAATQVTSLAVVMLAEPSLCNLVESGRAIADALPRRLRTLEVTGASHCDFEDPTNQLCQAVCGSSSEESRENIRIEIVTTTLELLDRQAARDPPAP
jgi:dienelactone hydrolase